MLKKIGLTLLILLVSVFFVQAVGIKIAGTSTIDSVTITGGIADTNATTACTGAEVLLGNSTCSPIASFLTGGDQDTNATTACGVDEVLDGDGDCVDHTNWLTSFTETDPIFVAENASLWLEALNNYNISYHNLLIWGYNQTGLGDTNATTACGVDEFLDGDGDCVTVDTSLLYNYTGITNSTMYDVYGGWWVNHTNILTSAYLKFWYNYTSTFIDTNATTACAFGEHLDGGGECYNTNDTIDQRTASITYFPSLVNVSAGTFIWGNHTDLWAAKEGENVTVQEGVGAAPVLTILVNYTGVVDFNSIIMREWYLGGLGHEIVIGLWDYDDTNWEEEYGEITDMENFAFTNINVLDASDHILDGVVQLRLNHEQNGIASHRFYLDYAVLVDGFSTTVNTEHDALTDRDLDTNHPQYSLTDGTRNFTGNLWMDAGVNFTAWYLFGNGSGLSDVCLSNGTSCNITTDDLSGFGSGGGDISNTSMSLAINDSITNYDISYNNTYNVSYHNLLIYGYNFSLVFNSATNETIYDTYSLLWTTTFNSTYAQYENITSFKLNLTSANCPTGNYSYGVLANGTMECRNDVQGSGGAADFTNVAYLNNSQVFTANQTISYANNLTIANMTIYANDTCTIFERGNTQIALCD